MYILEQVNTRLDSLRFEKYYKSYRGREKIKKLLQDKKLKEFNRE